MTSEEETSQWRLEILRRLDALEREQIDVRDRVKVIEITTAREEVHRAQIVSRLASIESSQTWIVRLIIGAVSMAMLATVLQGGSIQ